MQPQIRRFDAIGFFSDQHPFLVKSRRGSQEGERHHQAKQGENPAPDRAKTAPLAFRLFRTAPDTETAVDFQQK
jgi:hypothetical protein